MTLTNVRWLLDRDGQLTITLLVEASDADAS